MNHQNDYSGTSETPQQGNPVNNGYRDSVDGKDMFQHEPHPSWEYYKLAGSVEVATLQRRFGARLVDNAVIGLVTIVTTFAFLAAGQSGSMMETIVNVTVALAYFVGLEVSTGRTVGKRVLGLYVVGPDKSSKPSVKESALRNLFMVAAVIPMIGAGVALLAYVVLAVSIHKSPTGQGEHDKLAGGTRVLRSINRAQAAQ